MKTTDLKNVELIEGFATSVNESEGTVELLTKAALTSDQPEFFSYMRAIDPLLKDGMQSLSDQLASFVLVLHEDKTASLHTSPINILAAMKLKSDVSKKIGKPVSYEEVLDVNVLSLPNISFEATDRVIVCLKFKWRFALYFDLGRGQGEFDIEQMERSLAFLYLRLNYWDVFSSLEDERVAKLMYSDGWFPFIALHGSGAQQLLEAYRSTSKNIKLIERIVDSFSEDTLLKISEAWWSKDVFCNKKDILQSGLSSYLRDDYIASIKTLATEIEGILQEAHLVEHQKPGSSKVLPQYVAQKGEQKANNPASLYLSKGFQSYLEEVVYDFFDLNVGKVGMSRHTVSHGAATPEQYTKERALQIILCLDHVSHCL